MTFAAILFALKRTGYFFWDNARIILPVVAGIVVLILVIGFFKSCGSKPKLDQQEIIKAQQAIAVEDRKVMVEVLAESDVKEKQIDSSIKAAEEATEKSKREYSTLSNAELMAEIERRSKQ